MNQRCFTHASVSDDDDLHGEGDAAQLLVLLPGVDSLHVDLLLLVTTPGEEALLLGRAVTGESLHAASLSQSRISSTGVDQSITGQQVGGESLDIMTSLHHCSLLHLFPSFWLKYW